MKSKQLPCELCGKEVNIRSTLKEGENKGKKVCPSCTAKNKLPKVYTSKIKKQTTKNKKKRSEERQDFPEFFRDAILELQENPICQNCGCLINTSFNPSWNIAHILNKSKYKSVATNKYNKLFLCASKDINGNNCHEKFDSGLEVRKTMPVFELAVQNFVKFKDECLEHGKEFDTFDI